MKHKSEAWLQWKGCFDICMDLCCSCGCLSHYDGEARYYIQCHECKQTFRVDGTVNLEKITAEEAEKYEVAKTN